MRVLLVNVPPLGLLAIGGPLLDDGHAVRLIDGEFGPMRQSPGAGRGIVRPFRLDIEPSGDPVVSRAVAARLRRWRRWAP